MKVDKDDPEAIDMPLYVTAHEVAHQWWAHQVIGADVQGSTLMSETMSQYSSLMVMEKEYGKPAMRKFLKYEMDKYLKSRALESRKELPIMLAENQQYIHYNKGSVLMYALRDYIGEDSLNAALRKYIKKVAFQNAPYTTSKEFVQFMKDATPDSLKYIITDMFETITLYNNSVKEMTVTPTANGKYKVKFKVSCIKYRADSIGKEKEIPVSDWVDIGVFAEKEVKGKNTDKELLLKKCKLTKKEQYFEFIVDEKPVKVGIDPYHKLIDRTPENNTLKEGHQPIPDKSGGFGGVVVKVGGDSDD
jgi:ABC-2 type transport system permease protein